MDDFSDAETSMESAVSKLMAGDFPPIQNTPQEESETKKCDEKAPEKLFKLEQPVSMLKENLIGCSEGHVETGKEGKEGNVMTGSEEQRESQLADQPESSSQAVTDCQTKFKPDMFIWAKQNKRGVHWPARVAHISEKTPKQQKENHVWVYMYENDSFMWLSSDFIMEYNIDNADKMELANKSKSFKTAVEKLEEERVAELSGTSPVHFKVKKTTASTTTGSTRKRNQTIHDSTSSTSTTIPITKSTRAGRSSSRAAAVAASAALTEMTTGDSDDNQVVSADETASEGTESGLGGMTSTQTSLKEDDFTLTPDRVLDMLDKQLDMVSSSKYTSSSLASPPASTSTSSQQQSRRNASSHSNAPSSSRKRATGSKADEPRSKRAAPITCSDFSNDGLQIESSNSANQLEPGSSQSSSTTFSLDESPAASPSKAASHSCSPVVVPSSSHLLNKKGSSHTEVAQIKPIRRTQPFDKNVGFIGIGTIGHELAELLLKQNFNVYVWNKTPQKCSELRGLGAKLCISAGDVMARSDITFCCVTNTESVREVLVGTNGALTEMKRGKSFINLTTCDPKASTEFYQLVQMRNGRYLEAPLLGSRKDASSGNFLMLAAGDYGLYEEVLPCLELFSKRRSYVGAAGKACEMQVLMNVLYGNQLAVLAETMALCRKSGVDKQQLLSVLQSSDLASPFLVEKAEMIVGGNENYEGAEKRLSQQQTDLKIGLNLSDQLSQAMPITAACNELFKRSLSWGDEDLDMAVVYKAACL